MSDFEVLQEVSALAQELVRAEHLDPDLAMREAILCLMILRGYAADWDQYALELAGQRLAVAA
jgi:hypothetical protein